jgi:hypothetical protein
VEKQLEPYNTRLAELELLIAQGAFEVKVPNGKTMPIAELITRVKAQRKTKRDEVLSERGMSGPGGSLTDMSLSVRSSSIDAHLVKEIGLCRL